MAKHCTVCNRDYADELASCPHCASATQTQSAGRGQERTTQLANRGDERHTRLSPEEAAAKKKNADLIDLSAQPPKLPSKTPLDSSVVDLGALPGEAGESGSNVLGSEMASNASAAEMHSGSEVNLGGGPIDSDVSLPDPRFGARVEVADGSGIDVQDVAASRSDSALHPSSAEVDLDSEAGVAAGSGVDVGEENHSPASIGDIDLDSMQAEAVTEEETGEPLAEMDEAGVEEGGVTQEPDSAEETVAAADADEEAKPAKTAKPRSSALALAGSALVGIVVGAGGLWGVQTVMGPGEKPKTPVMPVASQARAAAPVTFEAQAARVAAGDWDEAKTAGIEQLSGASPKELVALGEYHLGSYLTKAGAKVNPQDPILQKAIQNLQKAAEQKDANALYDLALIKELAGQLPEALAEYAKGVQEFAKDSVQKQRFESAVSRVEWKISAKGVGAARIPLPNGSDNRSIAWALLLIALQQPPAAPQQPAQQGQQPAQPPAPQGQQPAPAVPADKPEAGVEFWQATKLAHAGKFNDAVAALDRARKLHDERRFSRLRKAQNPLSDPAEDIFLRCCDELKAYWQLEKQLREGGYLTDKNTPAQAFQELAQKAQGSGTKTKELADKLTAAEKNKKQAEAAVAELKPKLQKAAEENTKLAGDLKAKEKIIAERDAALTSAKEQNAKLKQDYEKHNAALTKIRAELTAAQLLDPKENADVSEAVKKTIDVAKTKDSQGLLRRQRADIERLSASLKTARRPEEMLPLWLHLLDENRFQFELADQAMVDAKSVLTDPRATATQKSRAEVVLGLALRNAAKFSEAKKVLETPRPGANGGTWRVRADAALREVSHPAAYFASRARDFYDRGRLTEALSLLGDAMKVLPANERGKLLAQRSLIELDAARSEAKGKLSPTQVMLMSATQDAEAAINAGAAEGHYAAGRISEELGRVDAAIQSYRLALATHGSQLDAVGARYRMALARVLLLPRGKAVGRNGRNGISPRSAAGILRRPALQKGLFLMMVLGLQGPLVPGEEPGQEEAEKLADEVLKTPPGTVPFDVLAQALAVKGQWNRALQVFVEGIRPMLPREYGNELVYLLSNDPRLKRPSSLQTPNPFAAGKHFASGLNSYFERDYANAERELLLAVENDSQDARFFYFLGLSRMAQNRRRDAFIDFDQAVMLEKLDRPSPTAVSESLERIQGPMRLLVNGFRERPQR